MDKDVYSANVRVLKKIKRKYNDRGKYPKGVRSLTPGSYDLLEYCDAVHYVLLYHLNEAVKTGDNRKADRLSARTTKALRELEECEKKLGIKPQNHGLEHITAACGLKI